MKRFFMPFLLLGLLLAACTTPQTTATPQPESPIPADTDTQSAPTLPPAPTATRVQRTDPTATSAPAKWLAYIGVDGNLWLLDRVSMDDMQLTRDGSFIYNFSNERSVHYQQPAWSSDGRFLAYQRIVNTPLPDRMESVESLWIFDGDSLETRVILEDTRLTGYAWEPGTHRIAFGLQTEPGYFTARGEVASDLAQGIQVIDLDSEEARELVAPQTYSLVNPQWSPDGSILSFEEVYLMEGSGLFAWYNLEDEEYFRWEEPIGGYDWSADGEEIVYDTLTYTPSGEELVFINNRMGTAEEILSPIVENGYAFRPAFSPDGRFVAYLTTTLAAENQPDQLRVLAIDSGEERILVELNQIAAFAWTADGEHLVVTAGAFDAPQLLEVAFEDGEVRFLADGWQPAIAK